MCIRDSDKADAPAGHGIGLREAVDNDRALLHAWERGNAGRLFSGVEQGVVDTVSYTHLVRELRKAICPRIHGGVLQELH